MTDFHENHLDTEPATPCFVKAGGVYCHISDYFWPKYVTPMHVGVCRESDVLQVTTEAGLIRTQR
jgi:hypothetical protein